MSVFYFMKLLLLYNGKKLRKLIGKWIEKISVTSFEELIIKLIA